MWAYARTIRLRPAPALLAALSYTLSGFLTTRFVHLSIMAGAALIPAVLWGIERLLQQPTRRRFVVATVCVALQAVSGHPQVPVYTAVAAGVYVAVQAGWAAWAERTWRPLLSLVQLAVVYLTAYALAALQLVPWFELATFSPRAAGASYDFVTFQSLGGRDWWLWLFPYAFGAARQSWLAPALPSLPHSIYVWERSAYIGVAPLLLAAVGAASLLWRPRAFASALPRRQGWALVAVLVSCGLIAAGRYTPVGHLVYALPVLGKLRAYSRAVAVVACAGSALAGLGLQAVLSLQPRRWPAARRWLVGAGVALLIAGVAGVAALPELSWRAPAAWLPLALLLAAVTLIPWWRRRWGQRALLALVALDLALFAANFNPTTAPAEFTAVPASVAFLQRDPSLFRTASFISTNSLAPSTARSQQALSWGLADSLSSINGFNSLQPRRYTDLLFGPAVGDVSYGFLGDGRLLQPDYPLLSLLDVKYALVQPQSDVTPGPTWTRVFADDQVAIYRNTRPFGRAFFVNSARPATAEQALARCALPRSTRAPPRWSRAPTPTSWPVSAVQIAASRSLSASPTSTSYRSRSARPTAAFWSSASRGSPAGRPRLTVCPRRSTAPTMCCAASSCRPASTPLSCATAPRPSPSA